MRRYIVKWADLELARNGKPGIGIGSKLQGTGPSELSRNVDLWNRNWPGIGLGGLGYSPTIFL